ncbi:MAG TPA: beta-propeller domain-containing protein, partial [Ramlibacter sp.]|nr:beta-propeller domain-containing protein [Ramlibacter sp.]
MQLHNHLGPAALVVAVLAACGGGGVGGLPAAGPSTGPGSGGTGLQTAKSGDLVSYARARLQQGTSQGLSLAAVGAAASPAPAAQDGTAGQAPQQESGVGEPDLLKTDGRHVHALHAWAPWASPLQPARLTSHRINADGSLTEVGSATLDAAFRTPSMHLAADIGRIAVIGEIDVGGNPVVQQAPMLTTTWPYRRRILLDVRPTPDRPAPAAVQRMEIDGHLVTSRLVGNVLYLASTWMADLSRYPVPAGSTRAQVEAATAGLTTQELLPTIRVDGGAAQPLVNEGDCLIQPANKSSSFQLTTLTAIDLGTGDLKRASRCLVGGTQALYMTAQSVYLASSETYGEEVFIAIFPPRFPAAARTDIHKFSLQGLQVDYRGSGQVQGHLGWDREKSPYRLSEHEGLLRVLSYTGQAGWLGAQGASQASAPS